MPLGCNFHSHPTRRTSLWLVLAILMIGLVAAVITRQYLLGQLAERQATLSELQHRAERHALAQSSVRSPVIDPEVLIELNRIAGELTRPWEAMLDHVPAMPAGIFLEKIHPDPTTTALRLQGRAADSTALLQFLNRLQADPYWEAVTPVSEERDALQPTHPLRFEVTVRWGAL